MSTVRRKRNFRNRLYSNLKMYLDDKLVARGWYDNVASGETDWHGNNMSQLLPVQTDPLYPIDTGSTVHVWQALRRNWVSESGFTHFSSGLTDPTIARSIYIDGVEYPSAEFDGSNGVQIDMRNGRVVLETPVAFTSSIEVPHSTKEVWVDTIARDMVTNQITALDNTRRVIVNNVPSGEIGQLPMILMDIGQQDQKGMQLGAGLIFDMTVFCHVVAQNRYDKDELIDFLQNRASESMTMVDLDTAPEQFTFYGDFASGWQKYSNLQTNYRDRLAYIRKVELVANDDIAENSYFTALLRMEVEIWAPETL